MGEVKLICADVLEALRTLDDGSTQCVVTSPPYWALRDYGCDGQIGLEATPEEYVSRLVDVFREVSRVLADDGVLWLNLGDSYATGAGSGRKMGGNCFGKQNEVVESGAYPTCQPNRMPLAGLKRKELIGIPWRVAFALQADGWYLRSDIIWSKPNPMPESVTDRPTKAHEYIFLMTKSERYYYDAESIREPAKEANWLSRLERKSVKSTPTAIQNGIRQRKPAGWDTSRQGAHGAFHREGRASDVEYTTTHSLTRNKRSVWTVATHPYADAHFATFPEKLVEPCILAGSRPGDVVLDPFNGAGTVGLVALRYGRSYVGIDINPEYIELTRQRLLPTQVQPALLEVG